MEAQAFEADAAAAAAGLSLIIIIQNAFTSGVIASCDVLPTDLIAKLIEMAQRKTGAPEVKLTKAPRPDADESGESQSSSRVLNPLETVQDAGLENGDTLLVVLMQNRMLLTVGDDGILRIWNITNEEPVVHMESKLVPERLLRSSCVSGDGRYLLTGTAASVAKLWNAKQGEQIVSFRANADQPGTRHEGSVSCVDIAPNGNLVCSGGNDFVAKVWDIRGPLVTALIDKTLEIEPGMLGPRTHELQLTSVKFSPDSQRVATCSADCMVKIWGALEGECLHKLCYPEQVEYGMHAVTSVCWAPSCQVLVSTADVFVTTWDARTGEEIRTWEAHTDQVTSATFALEGSVLVTGSRDSTAKIWDTGNDVCLRTLALEEKPPGRHEQKPRVSAVDIHPDGRHATTGYSDGSAKVWEIASGRCTHTFRKSSFAIQVASFVPI